MAAENRSRIQIYSAPAPAGEVTSFWREKYERDARKYWDIFYKRHQDKFFKDRHYLDKEWGRYFDTAEGEKLVVLEVGCGAGNTVFPLLATYEKLFIHACDFSPRAIDLVKNHKDFTEDKVHAFVCDLLADDLLKNVPPYSIDIVTMVFFLSAIAPEKMSLVLDNIKQVLKPNGCVLLRDYAAGDLAQERLTAKEQRISENFYVRGDGTRAFYFSIDFLTTLFKTSGFSNGDVSLCCKQVENRSQELVMNRRWIQAVFALDCHEIQHDHDRINNGSISAKSSENFDADMSESITELFSISAHIYEVVDVNCKDFTFKVRILDKENQHTCRSTGLMLWESARFMSLLLAENSSIVAGKNVLELGCGSAGICSMVAAQSAKFVVATDGDEKALDLLRENISLNLEAGLIEKLIITKLEWGNEVHVSQVNSLVDNEGGFEVIIGTDVTYAPGAIMPLFKTARLLLSVGGRKNLKPALVQCHIQRRVDEDSIVLAATQSGFRLVDRFAYGRSGSSGIISSWFSENVNNYFLHQKSPLNIMYFEL